jgi:hypothetical protein
MFARVLKAMPPVIALPLLDYAPPVSLNTILRISAETTPKMTANAIHVFVTEPVIK